MAELCDEKERREAGNKPSQSGVLTQRLGRRSAPGTRVFMCTCRGQFSCAWLSPGHARGRFPFTFPLLNTAECFREGPAWVTGGVPCIQLLVGTGLCRAQEERFGLEAFSSLTARYWGDVVPPGY